MGGACCCYGGCVCGVCPCGCSGGLKTVANCCCCCCKGIDVCAVDCPSCDPCIWAICTSSGSPLTTGQSGTSCPAPLPLSVASGGRSSACTIGNISQLGTALSNLGRGIFCVSKGVAGGIKSVKGAVNQPPPISSNTLLLVGAAVIGLVVVFGLGRK